MIHAHTHAKFSNYYYHNVGSTQTHPNYRLSLDDRINFIILLSSFSGQRGLTGPAGPPGPTAGGVVYTRWGRTTCPTTSGTQLVYTGRAAGSHWSHSGGGANYLCLPDNPNYLRYTNGGQNGRAYLYGAEYEGWDSAPLSAVHNHNVPCAVYNSS